MQTLLPLVEKIRSHFLSAYRKSLAEYLAIHSPASAEVLFELKREVPHAFRLYRADMASNAGGTPEIQEVIPETHMSFEPFEIEPLQGLHLKINPMAWYGVDFRLNTSVASAPLESWALRWLDVEDQHQQDTDGLQSVIHSVTASMVEHKLAEFSVDFGSAPVRAFEELLQVLQEVGATDVEVRSSCIE